MRVVSSSVTRELSVQRPRPVRRPERGRGRRCAMTPPIPTPSTPCSRWRSTSRSPGCSPANCSPQASTEPSGDGDVRIWPTTRRGRARSSCIALRSPDGEALLQAERRPARRVPERRLRAVPAGPRVTATSRSTAPWSRCSRADPERQCALPRNCGDRVQLLRCAGRAGPHDLQRVVDVDVSRACRPPSWPIARRQAPSTSTVAPQCRQTRWWWWPSLHRRYIASRSGLCSTSTSPASARVCNVR